MNKKRTLDSKNSVLLVAAAPTAHVPGCGRRRGTVSLQSSHLRSLRLAMAEAQAVARARAEQQEARQKKSDALAAAIEREDYSAAAALKKELDELG